MGTKDAERPPLGGLTSLRFFAASYVLLFHTRGGKWFGAGFTGVTLFFVLSGFILAYNHPVIRSDQRTRFYISRFARIYPLYLASFFLMLPWFVKYDMPGRSLGYYLGCSAAYLLLIQTWIPRLHWTISAASWTMPVETFFYILFPFCVTWLSKVRKGVLLIAVFWVALVVPSVMVDLIWIPAHPGAANFLRSLVSIPLFHLGEFLIGIILGLRFVDRRPVFRGHTVLGATAFCVAGLALVGRYPYYSELWVNGSMALPFGLLIYAIAGWKSRVLSHPLLQVGGEISYSIYLLQLPLVEGVQRIFLHTRSYVPLRFALLLGFAFLSYQCIEKPGRRLVLRLFRVRSHPKPIETSSPALP